MRHPVTDELAAALWDDGKPASCILLKAGAFERIELIADENRNGHVKFLSDVGCRHCEPTPIIFLARHPCFVYDRTMKAGPDIAMIASLVGDPARANMLTALMTGRALTASELAHQAGITPQTASSHLAKLESGGLIEQEKQGRHRYYRLADPDVAGVLEGLAGLAARAGHMRVRTGPKDPALRRARVCYDHLAGDLGVQMLDSMKRRKLVRQHMHEIELTALGARFIAETLQIDADELAHPRRPVCKACLDWSERRHHLAGTLGAALMRRFTELKWASRDSTPGSRVVNFSRNGERRFAALFGGGQ
jgi:DNA-binding transcriptional ArsR family regulator